MMDATWASNAAASPPHRSGNVQIVLIKEEFMAKINPIELQKSLKGVDYPASKEDVIKAAEKNGADDEIMDALQNLSDDSFEKPTDVTKALSDDM
jgi:hypothetical protein